MPPTLKDHLDSLQNPSFIKLYSLDILVIDRGEGHCEDVVRLSIDVQLGFLNKDERCGLGNHTVSWSTVRAVLAGHPELVGGVVL